jgi:ankyrin repeat protein
MQDIISLLAKEVDIYAVDNEDKTALQIAKENKNTDFVIIMEAIQSIDPINLFEAAIRGDVEEVKFFANSKNVNKTHEDPTFGQITALHVACQMGHTDVVKALIARGADLDLAKNPEITPLQYACKNGYTDVVKALIARGADLDLADKYGNTPLLMACINGHIASAQVLWDAGANVDCLRVREPGILYGYKNIIKSEFKNVSEEIRRKVEEFINPKNIERRDKGLERKPSTEAANAIGQEFQDNSRDTIERDGR